MPEVIRDAAGKPFSKWKPAAKYEHVLRDERPEFAEHATTEFQFDDVRKWRFDFAWPDAKVAVEIDGFGYGHQAQQNLAKSNEKQNAAVQAGWRVLRFDSRTLGSRAGVERAVELTCAVLCGA